MILDSIKLAGWRSYDTDGVELNNLKSINLIIGPNNSGKSNLFRYFNYLKKVLSTERFKEGGSTTIISELEESQKWRWESNDVICNIKLSNDNNVSYANKNGYPIQEHDISLISKNSIELDSLLFNVSVDGFELYDVNGLIKSDIGSSSSKYIDASDNVKGYFDNSNYWKAFLSSLVFVDPIRHHVRSSGNSDDYYFDGAKIIKNLDTISSDTKNKSRWLQYKLKMTSWLSEILSEEITSIEVDNADLRIDFKTELSFSLSELGTGVSQVVMLLSHLWINKDVNLNIFLEEPEANLHPDSVVKLVKIFEEELTNHRFFITTHSPSLIDCVNDHWSVFGIAKQDNGASKVTPNDNVIRYYETLDNLGVKASQILQANTVIWVEGPSDRIYLKKWIEELSGNELKEGKDFSFLYFGGTNLASFTVLEDVEQDFINVLSTSRKAYLVTDSDCKSRELREGSAFKAYLSSMLDRVSVAAEGQSGVSKSLEDYFGVWVTEGREIENYIDKDLLFKILISQGFKRTSIGSKSNHKKLCLCSENVADFTFDDFDSFDEAIANMYQYSESNEPLDSDALKNVKIHYASKKVTLAKEVSKIWEKSHVDSLNLEQELIKLIAFIKS
ncbi:ATP-dependent nuclease [Vibrio crassostreae]|uniref:ATP-dependent nuclease n=1 Tax=Vibrio crassostreae TaxID=246167 RepID=UPI001B308CE7